MSDVQDYTNARKNMVECQIHPMGVTHDGILEAFSTVPREAFVPNTIKPIVYCDEDVAIGGGRYLLEPSIIARMMQQADLKSDDVCLTIGSGAGYTAALLSKMVSTVVCIEEDKALLEHAQATWDAHDYCNIVGLVGDITKGAPDHAPYSLIIINGCVSHIPAQIKEQLAPEGRMLGIIQPTPNGAGKATLVDCNDEGICSSRVLFDAHTPYLNGFEPKETFRFG